MQITRKKYTVLLLSAPIGSGHRLAAEALEQALADRPEVEVIHGNIFDFFPQFLGKAFLGTYLWILKCCPWLCKLAYSWGNKQGGSLWLRELLNRLLARLGGNYLRSVQPDAVIATHATPAGIIGYYKKQHPKLWLRISGARNPTALSTRACGILVGSASHSSTRTARQTPCRDGT